MCTVPQPPGGNPIAFNKYIMSTPYIKQFGTLMLQNEDSTRPEC